MHFDRQTAQKLLRSELSTEETTAVLQEASLCEECAALLAEVTERESLIPIPWGFAESTLLSILPEPEPASEPRKSESLFLYAVKVVAAMCAALALIFSGFLNDAGKVSFDGVRDTASQMGQQLEDTFRNLSDRRYNQYLEEHNYGK